MPRPRILCSPRSKPQNAVDTVDPRPKPRVITISESEEPDCEIIKIEEASDKRKNISIPVQGVVDVQYQGSQYVPSMLSLQFLPSATSSDVAGNSGGQNIVMVLPVSSSQSQGFNPTLCTLEKIESPHAISEIKEVVISQKKPGSSDKNVFHSRADEKEFKKTRKDVLQSVFTHISAENRRQIKKQVSNSINENEEKIDASVETENDDDVRQEASTAYSTSHDRRSSDVGIKSDVSSKIVDDSGKSGNSNLRTEEAKDNASGNKNKSCATGEFFDTSVPLKNREEFEFEPKKSNAKSNNSRIPSTKISLSKISIPKKNLIRNGTTASSIGKKATDYFHSGIKIKTATLVLKRFVDDKKIASLVRKKATDDLVEKSKQSKLQSQKNTDDENTSADIDKKANSPRAPQSTASKIKKCETELLWSLNCIVCKRNFVDRAKLHRHATLAHPDVQILFCKFCNDSFLSHEKLEAHRVKNCKSEITEILETIVIEDEDNASPSEEDSGNILKEDMVSKTKKLLETQNTKKNKTSESQNLKNCLPAGILIRRKRGRPRKNFANFVVTHKYVEEEVINHTVGEKKRELVTAEIKKLVVPLARLEDSTLKKYLEKRTDSPLSDYEDEEEKTRPKFRRKKRGRPRKNYNNVGNLKRTQKTARKFTELRRLKTNLRSVQEMGNETFLRRTDKIVTRNSLKLTRSKELTNAKNRRGILDVDVKKRPIYTDTDDTSDDTGSEYIPVVEENDSGNNRRSIIRKLPSRSSAASLMSIKTGVKNLQRQRVKRSPEKTYGEWILRRQKIPDHSNSVETPVKKHAEPENSPISSERSQLKTVDDTTLDESERAQLEEVSKNLEENRLQNEEKAKKSVVTRKTYLPSKRKVVNASKFKRRCDPVSDSLCLMCKELLQLMKQLSIHFDGNKANKISVKCPLCNLYFISMFYLKKHVARFHLHCTKQFPSQLSESLMLTKSGYDESLDCETEIVRTLECQHCPDKFSAEKNLVDHVFTLHDSPFFYADTATDFPYYVDDLPSSYFQKSSCLNSVESSSKSQPSNAENRLNVKQKSAGLRSVSVEDKAANNSSKSGKQLEKNSTSEGAELSDAPESDSKSVKWEISFKSANMFTESPNNSTEEGLTSPPIKTESYCSEEISGIKAESYCSEEMSCIKTESYCSEEIPCTKTESYCSDEIPSAWKPTKEEQTTSDCDDLLRQLLSDDSNDSFDNSEAATSRYIQKVSKTWRKTTVKNEREFTRPQCHVCDKEFRTTQDLLIHSLEHDYLDTGSEENASSAVVDLTDHLFSDSIEYNWSNEGLAVPAALESQTEESETAAPLTNPIADDLDTSDVLFGSGDENSDFSLVYEINSGPRTETDSERTRSPAYELPSSKKEQTENSGTKESRVEKRASKLAAEATEPQTKKLKVLQEFLETEEGLANPDEADSTRKLPIECSKCNRKFPNRASLNEHLFFLHDDSLKATVLTDVVTPLSRPGDESSKEPRQWRCDECLHNFKLLQSYGRHRYFVHGDDEMVHVCENCCKVMTTVTMVNVHICTDVASYNCRTCNETFSTGMSLRLHNMYKHKETEGPHQCLPCNKKFLTNAMLKRHEKWKHRFMRPYRPRKSSPVHMATPEDVASKCDDDFEENEMDSGCDQEYADMEYEFTGKEVAKGRQRVPLRPNAIRKKRRSQEENTSKQESRNLRKDPSRQSRLVTYIDEDEIIQCNLCRLYCLSMAALRTHMAKSHSIMGEVCRICEKMYSQGKLVRHMIDQHINPCETFTEDRESIWNVGKNVEENDAEELIRILGMSRFISLCEYQRFSEPTQDGAIRCPNCTEEFESCEDYKHHFLMRHDIMCALCNIEFKSGDKAAAHKIEDHGSVDSYIWFADQTVGALTAATNFSEAAEKSFIEMISRDSDESQDENEDEDCGEENQTSEECFTPENDVEYNREEKWDAEESLPETLDDQTDQKLMIVVTEDDLHNYGIGTRNPNIWGLASKISSTSTELTPKDVKVMLDSYFER